MAISSYNSCFNSVSEQLAENCFLFLVSVKEQKRYKSEFVTKFVAIIVTIIFI